jgi:hypothetical protein
MESIEAPTAQNNHSNQDIDGQTNQTAKSDNQ